MPLKRSLAEFDSYDVREQYKVYRCGCDVVHPPHLHLAGRFAQRGAAAVPLLRYRLRIAGDDETIRDIVLVLVEMQRLGTYDVDSDLELVQLMRSSVGGMRDEGWKRMSIDLMRGARLWSGS
jgi:hypothetical protein